jgi:cobalamin biosynthesis protein CobD/CbiB
MGRIGRSFQLVGLSYRILMLDKELMVLPLISGAVTLLVALSFAFGLGITPSRVEQGGVAVYLPLFGMYVIAYTVGIFFQAAVVAGATDRMRGGDPTIRSALAAASRRLGTIVAWAVLAATVGTIIRAIHDRAGFVGKIATVVAGAAWSLATFFIVPVLVLEDRSIRESFNRSVSVFKQTWGESLAGGTTLGAAGLCAWLTLVAVSGLLAWTTAAPAALGVFFVGAIALTVFFSSLQGIYVATLYRYATEGVVPVGFDSALLQEAFKHRQETHTTLGLHKRSSR